MIGISNSQFAEVIRTLTYYTSLPATTLKEREAQRKATLLARKLKRKQSLMQKQNGLHD